MVRSPRAMVVSMVLAVATSQMAGAARPAVAAGGVQAGAAGSQADALDEAARLDEKIGQLYQERRYDEAVPLAERVLAIYEKALRPDHPNVVVSLNNLAMLYWATGAYAKAEPLLMRALAIREKALGPDHPDLAQWLNNLAELYEATGAYAKAEPLYERVLAIYAKAFGPDHPNLAILLYSLAALYMETGAYAKAEPLLIRAVAICEKALRPDHPDLAQSLNNLAMLYQAAGEYAKAEPLFVRALAIREKALGPDHPDLAQSLNNLAELYRDTGAYAKAEPLHERALAIYAKAFGPDDPNLARSLNNLAALYQATGEYAKAEPLLVRGVAIYEKALGPDHRNVATSLNNLAALYQVTGEYARAELLLVRALAIREKALGPDHPDVATSLNNLAALYQATGKYAKAEPLYERALAVLEKALGPDHPDLARSLHNLAWLYRLTGAYAKAEPLLVRSMAICEKALGPDHPDVVRPLSNLALLYQATGEYAKAEPLYERALAVLEKALGPDHPDLARSLHNLAWLYRDTGAYAKAEPLLVRALVVLEKALGPDHPDLALSLSNLALLYRDTGAYAKAESLLVRALAIYEKALGSDHPNLAILLHNLAELYYATAVYAKALQFERRANDATERDLVRNLGAGSEQRKLQYLATTAEALDTTVSLHLRALPSDPQAARAALEVVLRRKGRALDAMTDAIASLRKRASGEDQTLLDQLEAAQARLATVTLQGPGTDGAERYRQDLAALEEQVDRLQAQVSSRSAAYRAQATPITLEAVERAVPAGAALVEYIVYEPYDAKAEEAKRFGAARYAVYTLTSTGQLSWRDLGEAAPIDAAVAELRAALRDAKREDVRRLARALDAKVFAPVRGLAGTTHRLLISPDGALNLVPFDALVDESDQYAVESYEISYLSSGRDLLRLAVRGESSQPPHVFANPEFGPISAGSVAGREIEHQASAPEAPAASILAQAYFSPLAGTAAEAEALRGIVPGAQVMTGARVTKEAFGRLDSPRILHVATHGFFLAASPAPKIDARDLQLAGSASLADRTVAATGFENPLLRSGLALAGANLHRGSDGILTAYEVSGLDLWGTKLVVLSACDTGVGEVKVGDGVYGLRRALVLAGSETQVMSLWPVSDAGTRDLMVAYYKALVAGDGRSAAMRRVRLAMLADPTRRHPFYWASFIVSGAWEPVGTQR